MNQKLKEALQTLFALVGLGVMIVCFYMASEVKKHERVEQPQAIGASNTVQGKK